MPGAGPTVCMNLYISIMILHNSCGINTAYQNLRPGDSEIQPPIMAKSLVWHTLRTLKLQGDAKVRKISVKVQIYIPKMHKRNFARRSWCDSIQIGSPRSPGAVRGSSATISLSSVCGGVVQPVRTPACHAGGRGFESRLAAASRDECGAECAAADFSAGRQAMVKAKENGGREKTRG
jgi:hypothetical protein